MGTATITLSFCLKAAVWSRGAVVPEHCSQDIRWGRCEDRGWRKGRLRRKLVPFLAPSNSASAALNSGFCLNFVSGDDSMTTTF